MSKEKIIASQPEDFLEEVNRRASSREEKVFMCPTVRSDRRLVKV
jgi:hypothetical protein